MEEKRPNPAHNKQRQQRSDLSKQGKADLIPEAENFRFARRSFLKAAGFSLSGAVLSACERAPVEKAIPYLVQPEDIIPGEALFYSSTCRACPAGCGLLVKTVDGRPIKLEGNPGHPLSRGGLCAIGQASILDLYDSHRPSQPLRNGEPCEWDDVDLAIGKLQHDLRSSGRAAYLVTGTETSPATNAVIKRFLEAFEVAHWISYDACSSSAILDAHVRTHHSRLLPSYYFHKADTIVSFGADFLGTWISPVEFAAGYREGRNLEDSRLRFSHHVQYEAQLTLTGAKADRRICLHPDRMSSALGQLAGLLIRRSGRDIAVPVTPSNEREVMEGLNGLGERLWNSKGKSLVVSGSQRLGDQVLVNLINELLGNYGKTLDVRYPSTQRHGDESKLMRLVDELAAGSVGAVFIAGANPVYDTPLGQILQDQLKKVPLVCISQRLDETSSLADWYCPTSHFLEAWGDASPTAKVLSLQQPVVQRLGNTRSLPETLETWLGNRKNDYEIVREHWKTEQFSRRVGFSTFDEFWDESLESGFAKVRPERNVTADFDWESLEVVPTGTRIQDKSISLLLHPTVGQSSGQHAHNPWLHELPDPITRVSWGNCISVSPRLAEELGVETGEVLQLEARGSSDRIEQIRVPALVQPGLCDRVISLPLGYGRNESQRFSQLGPDWLDADKPENLHPIGANGTYFMTFSDMRFEYSRNRVTISKVGTRQKLALAQIHDSTSDPKSVPLGAGKDRDIIREVELDTLLSSRPLAPVPAAEELWMQDHAYSGHHWAMAIDLTACTGCSACVIACQAENNIPVVGRDEAVRQRAMHWLRIDRYYSSEDASLKVAFQPMLCQHCDQAPCETVCPVLATVHSKEGLNQQIYNRCVGTRYCANNCPYKVRAFNWFDYSNSERLENLQLNPDVTVRSRGVMEKCTFCVQRIQKARITARHEGRSIAEGEVEPACRQSCPSEAIVFGDLNDPESRLSKLWASPRAFRVLEELGVEPSIAYLAIVKKGTRGNGGADGA